MLEMDTDISMTCGNHKQRDIQNIRIKLAKAEIREISFHLLFKEINPECTGNYNQSNLSSPPQTFT